MPKLRRMSGDEVAAILSKFGFSKVAQRGSHMKLRRLAGGMSQTLTIPAHRELDSGTLRAIIRQASRFVPEEDLHPDFYS
jgi:predicted RNA binding protein YcfA (HicA-like mRNA interferase family)